MKRKMTLVVMVVVLGALVFGQPFAYAIPYASHNSGTVKRLFAKRDGTILVQLSDRPATAEDCGKGQYYFVRNDEVQRDAFYAALLAGFAAGKKVGLRVSNDHLAGDRCEIAYVMLEN